MKKDNSIWQLLADLEKKKGISEIIINNVDKIFVEREGSLIQLDEKIDIDDIDSFLDDISKMNLKLLSVENPILDGRLHDGSRINVIMEPFANGFPAITIRKYLKHVKTFESTSNIFGLSPFWINFIKSLVRSKMNLLISGGTGAGKTTFLNLLLKEIYSTERIITIEDTLELDIDHSNCVRLECFNGRQMIKDRVVIKDLVRNTLRMRPDRIILGEVRGEEVFDLLQAMNTGHDGSMTSIHANSTFECLTRMETLYLLSGYDVPLTAIRKQISFAVDFLIHLERGKFGERIVQSISEISGMEGDIIQLQEIGNLKDDVFVKTGGIPRRMKKIHKRTGLPLEYFADI